MKHLSGKTVVIDTSIYLYKFHSDNALMENMYLFISILKSYKITPVFIFDGKPPTEKKELLKQRRLEKKEAEEKYKQLETAIKDTTIMKEDDRKEMLLEMEQLKRQFIRIRDEDIRKVKDLMNAYGVCYYESESEADKLCAYMVKSGKAWACFSDDMDMFLYGCPRVIRHLSLMNHTVVLYDYEKILEDLSMSGEEFCETMVISGTDYNLNMSTSLHETMKWYRQYKKDAPIMTGGPHSFYNWLKNTTKYIKDYDNLLAIYELFQFTNQDELEKWNQIEISERVVDTKRIQSVMSGEGFVFK